MTAAGTEPGLPLVQRAGLARLRGGNHPLRGSRVAVVDVETTGLKPGVDRVVQIAVVEIESLGSSAPRVVLDELVNPGIAIPLDATKIHGIATADVAEAPSFGDIADRLLEAVEGCVLAAYNAPFDVSMINAELRMARRRELAWDPLDPLVWVKRVDKFEKGKRLSNAAARRGILVDAHGAAGDATTTAMLMPRLLRELAQGGHCRIADLQTRDAFARWQVQAALDAEIDFVRFQLSTGKTGPFDMQWHAMEGIEAPAEVRSKAAAVVAGPNPEKCRSCQSPILWQVTKAGRAMPLDPAVVEVVPYEAELVDPEVHAQRLENVVVDGGEVVRGWRCPPELRTDLPRVRGRISHFATCPNASGHRRNA